jgi:tRNA(Arg) A34 adenosine deaminase TadA
MREAIRLADEGMRSRSGGPFGAVIVRDGTILGSGRNRVTSSNDPTAHAEVEAIRAACAALGSFQLQGCEIYTSCEPCPMCLAACYWARLDAIYYAASREDAASIGFDDAAIYEEIPKPPHRRNLRMEQILREQIVPVMEAWRKMEDRVPY